MFTTWQLMAIFTDKAHLELSYYVGDEMEGVGVDVLQWLESMCKKVWCGRWRLLHLCEDLQSLTICHPFRQLIQRLFLGIVVSVRHAWIWTWDRGWHSVLRRMQLPKVSELAIKVVTEGSDFLDGFLFVEDTDVSDAWPETRESQALLSCPGYVAATRTWCLH